MSEFYGQDHFPPHVAPGFRKYWLREGMRLVRIRKTLEEGVDDDDTLYKLWLDYDGKEAAQEALYQRKCARRDAQAKTGG